MTSEKHSKHIKPRVIIHGGAGNITPSNTPPHLVQQHKQSLLSILRSTNQFLQSNHDVTALDAACHAVSLLELDPLYDAAVGTVFTRAGTVELEASVMVSDPNSVKRGACVSHIKHVKSPIKLAREVLLKGDEDPAGGDGAQGHVHLSGEAVEALAKKWGLEMCEPEYFWTRQRWEEHRRGLKSLQSDEDNAGNESFEEDHYMTSHRPDGTPWASNDPTWDGKDYLPQGTTGCVVLDQFGTIAVATSTGGMTNKLPGRIGDTPSFGSGFWAEEWLAEAEDPDVRATIKPQVQPWDAVMNNVKRVTSELDPFGFLESCLPFKNSFKQFYNPLNHDHDDDPDHDRPLQKRALAISGTGNGDSFLRLAAAHTAFSLVRFNPSPAVFPPALCTQHQSSRPRVHALSPTQPTLASALNWMAGPGGKLQQSARDRWHKTGEGEGGMIGIEMIDGVGHVNYAFNCGGMFRAFIDNTGREHWGIWEDHEVGDAELVSSPGNCEAAVEESGTQEASELEGEATDTEHVQSLAQTASENVNSLKAEAESNPTSRDFPRAPVGATCSEILRLAMKKYNIDGNPEQYNLLIGYGDVERRVELDEQPGMLYNQLMAEGKRPCFIVRKISPAQCDGK